MSITLLKKRATAIVALSCLTAGAGYGQLSGNYTVGTGGNYPNLTGSTGLFHNINTLGMSGNVTATIISDIAEPATDSLKDFTSGGTNNYYLNIKPDAAVQRNITGTSAAFMITFYGVRNLTIDGSFAGSGTYLRFSNDNSGNSAGSLKFLYGCVADTIANCILESSSAGTSATNNTQKAATVLLDAATTSTPTNANLVFNNNTFRNIANAANFPPSHLRAIDIDATTANNAVIVTGNQFINSRIESVRTGSNSNNNNSLGWTITGNAFYATANTGAASKTAIFINRGIGHVISNNYIGGSNATATGSAYVTGGAFSGIYASFGNGILIDHNTIANITVSAASPSATSNSLYGIQGGGAGARITNNMVNNLTSNNCTVIGYFISGNSDTLLYNTAKNLSSTLSNTTSNSSRNSIGISLGNNQYAVNNTIDNITGYSKWYEYAASPTGIYVNSVLSGPTIVENNTITNVGNLDNTALTYHGASVSGITVASNSTTQPLTVKGNYITNIYGANTSANGNNIAGIIDFSGTTGSVTTNTYSNNVIALGSNTSNIPATAWLTGIQIGSLYASTFNLINNTIAIPSGLNLNSAIDTANRGGAACFARLNNLPVVNLQNNVFSNSAANAGTGAVAALNIMKDASGGAISSNYNVYSTSNTNTIIADAGTTYSLSSWKTLKSIDSMTTVASAIPFVSNADLHINTTAPGAWNVYGRGIAITDITTDKDGNARSTTVGIPVTAGAYEIVVPASTPADMTIINGTPTVGTPTELWSNGRKIAEINWASVTSAPSAFSAKFYPGVQAPYLDYANKTNAYFEVNETGFAGSYTIKQYVNVAEGAGQSFSSLRAAKRHGTDPYTFIANAGSNSADVNGIYLQSTAQTTFSTFGMAAGSTPLAIRLKDIEALNAGADNHISWTTASEASGDLFELQSATDGISFKAIATIKASGTPDSYDYLDKNAAKGITYYRLKFNAANGSAEYSNVVSAVVARNKDLHITVLPNPASDFITVRNIQRTNSTLQIELTDITGRVVKSVNSNDPDTIIDLKSLPAGTYIVSVLNGLSVFTTKIVKH